jgi:hypothetical protein
MERETARLEFADFDDQEAGGFLIPARDKSGSKPAFRTRRPSEGLIGLY